MDFYIPEISVLYYGIAVKILEYRTEPPLTPNNSYTGKVKNDYDIHDPRKQYPLDIDREVLPFEASCIQILDSETCNYCTTADATWLPAMESCFDLRF